MKWKIFFIYCVIHTSPSPPPPPPKWHPYHPHPSYATPSYYAQKWISYTTMTEVNNLSESRDSNGLGYGICSRNNVVFICKQIGNGHGIFASCGVISSTLQAKQETLFQVHDSIHGSIPFTMQMKTALTPKVLYFQDWLNGLAVKWCSISMFQGRSYMPWFLLHQVDKPIKIKSSTSQMVKRLQPRNSPMLPPMSPAEGVEQAWRWVHSVML